MAEFNFLKEYARMLKIDKDGECTIDCAKCPIKEPSGTKGCLLWVVSHPDEATEIVRKWSEEHPMKTRKSEFLKMFPNAKLDSKGNPFFCPKYIDVNLKTICGKNPGCNDCANAYWNEPVDDE